MAALAFSADGKRIAAGCADRTARVWDAGTWKPIQDPLRHTHPVRAVAFSPDGNRLACGMAEGSIDRWIKAQGVRVWDLTTGKEAVRLDGANDTGWVLAFSPDGNTLVAGGDGVVRFWDAGAGAFSTPFRIPSSVP